MPAAEVAGREEKVGKQELYVLIINLLTTCKIKKNGWGGEERWSWKKAVNRLWMGRKSQQWE